MGFRQLRAVIDGTSEETLLPEAVSRDDQCVLGKWIHGTGSEQFGHDHQFSRLKHQHAHFHVCAGRVLTLAQTGQTEAALKELNKGHYVKASMKIVQDLAQMYNRLKP
ncbi:CZB domain-containing protein [Methylomagnum sp.]